MKTLKTTELLMIVGRGTHVIHGVVQLFSFLLVRTAKKSWAEKLVLIPTYFAKSS